MVGADLTSCVCAGPMVLVHVCDPRQLENSWILQATDPNQQLLMQKSCISAKEASHLCFCSILD